MFFLVVQYVQRVLDFGPFATGLAFLPVQPRDLRDVAGDPAADRRVGRAADAAGRDRRDGAVGYVWLSGLSAGDTYAGARLRAGADRRVSPPASSSCRSPRPSSAASSPSTPASASGLLQTTQQLGGAVGVAAIVSVYATGAVPGQFVPGARAAFLTSAAFSLVGSSWSPRWRWRPAATPEPVTGWRLAPDSPRAA